MRKHAKILEYAISALFRRKHKNIAVITVYTLVVAVLASILFLFHSLKTEAVNLLQDAPEITVQKMMGGRHDLVPKEYIDKISRIFGVGAVVPRHWGYYYDSVSGSNYTLMGLDESVRGLDFLDGALPSARGECAIGSGIADVKGIDVGGKIYFINSAGIVTSYKVSGIFNARSALLTNDLVLLGEEDVIEFFGMPRGMATDIVVEINNDFEVPYVVNKIREMLPDTRPIMKIEIIRTYDSVFSWRGGMVLAMFSGALLAFCILAWDKATGLSADEKHEIGVLKAIGWDTADVLELKFWEGAVISVSSFLTGLILAYIHVFYFNSTVFSPVLKGWSVLFPEFRLVPYIDLYQISALLFFTVFPYIAATIVPSWKASITEPDSVMRG